MRPTKPQTTETTKQTLFEVARILKTENGSHLKAFVDVKVGNAVLVKGVRVLSNKEGGLFVSMPSQKAADGKYYETVRLLAREVKQELQDAVLTAYNS